MRNPILLVSKESLTSYMLTLLDSVLIDELRLYGPDAVMLLDNCKRKTPTNQF